MSVDRHDVVDVPRGLRTADPARSWRGTAVAGAAASVAVWLVFVARSGFVVDGRRYFSLFDDAMISMRYARNLAAGDGLVWNAGEAAVEGYTNLLWTLWMAVLHLVGLSEATVSLGVMATGIALLAANLLVVTRLARRLTGSDAVVALTVVLVGLYYPLFFWTLRGMEVGLLALVVSAGALLAASFRDAYDHRRLLTLLAVLTVGVLTRTDFLLPAAVIAVFAVLLAPRAARRRVALTLGLGLAAVVVAHTAFRLGYYGDPLPNTYYLKLGDASSAMRVEQGARVLLRTTSVHLWVALAFAGLHLLTTGRRDRVAWLLAAVFAVQAAYSVYVGGDAWENMLYANRYLTIAMPGVLVLAAVGIDDAVREHRRRLGAGLGLLGAVTLLSAATTPFALAPGTVWAGLTRTQVVGIFLVVVAAGLVLAGALLHRWPPVRPVRRHLAVGLLAGLVFVGLNALPYGGWVTIGASHVETNAELTRYGLAIRSATTDDARVAVVWAGAVPYFSERPAIDLLGKNDARIARGPLRSETLTPSVRFHPGHMKWDYEHSIGELRPDLIAQLGHASPADVQRLVCDWGYRPIAAYAYVRSDSDRVDVAALSSFASRHQGAAPTPPECPP